MAVSVGLRLLKARINLAALTRLADRVLAAAGEVESELSIELVGDGRMRRLNRTYRKKDRTTDVLAFPMREARNPHPVLLGDVVISVPTAARQARQAGRSLDEELAALLIHGVLHLCGYDHERGEREARRMARRERAVFRAISPVPRLVTTPNAGRRGTR
ncbi:rRNA maturation RNase YbeY [Nitrospira moscoviensis]|uniref:Endoribonuclease YbeY n=1 Tax=Nitrospira moscoviensis TaxID=42253 RepID=A0A0K2GIQ0_NITMO|nr:rRNA maturation RNase YbeY [Nitrospira moscoviensis]ALA60816.1 putative rRNA maturation factor [Nitrospira moscoviensis]